MSPQSHHRTEDADRPEPSTAFVFDITADEIRRRSLAGASLGPARDIAEEERREAEAYALLYSGLDAEQQRLYDDLVTAGVLPVEERTDAAR
ncbi:DUF6400 family protein [Kitasatospora arboriphila]|uniref:Uncharacterized protein n=1 Tax=Kitasatospora arboriphila TaxID=258052 RepID=A0ABP4E816_9ACTN